MGCEGIVQSSTVTADGMKVQAQAEQGIEITYATSGTWGSVATSTAETGKLFPTSTNNVTNWYHAKANASTNKAAINNTYVELDLDTAGKDKTSGHTSDQYYAVYTYTIRSATATTATALTIDSVTATASGTNTADLNKALRVAVKIAGDTNTYIYSPASGETTYQIWDGSATDGPSVDVSANAGTTAQSTSIDVPQSGVEVKVYVWYEGEDQDLKSANLPATGVTIDTMNITVQFSATVA